MRRKLLSCIGICLSVVLLAGLFAGCNKKKEDNNSSSSLSSSLQSGIISSGVSSAEASSSSQSTAASSSKSNSSSSNSGNTGTTVASTNVFTNGNVELLTDRYLNQGFILSSTTDGTPYNDKDVLDMFGTNQTKAYPAWRMTQWWSKYPLQGAAAQISGSTSIAQNQGKKITVDKNSSGKSAAVTLEMSGLAEYGSSVLQEGQAWPHLSIEQSVREMPNIDEINKLVLSADMTINKCDNKMTSGYDPAKHTALFSIGFIVQDRAPSSPGFGDMYWLQFRIFDPRYTTFSEYLSVDAGKEGASGKMIFGPDSTRFFSKNPAIGEKLSFSADVYPLLKEGYTKSRAKGYLKNTLLSDLYVTEIAWGWEMFGTFDVSSTISNMSLQAHYVDNRTIVKNAEFKNGFTKTTDWKIMDGGWQIKDGVATDLTGSSWTSRIVLKNKVYDNFTMEFEHAFDKKDTGAGWSGVSFRKMAALDDHQLSGCSLHIRTDGTVVFYQRNKYTDFAKIPNYDRNAYTKYKIIAKGGNYKLYVNDAATPILEFNDNSFLDAGYVGLCSGMSKCSYKNFKITPNN